MALTGAPAIGYFNWADGITPTSSVTAATGYSLANLGNGRISSTWRSAGDDTAVPVDTDLGAARDIDVVALLGANLTDDGTETTVIDDTSNYSSPLYAPGVRDAYDLTHAPVLTPAAPAGRHIIHLPGSTITARYVRVTLDDGANPDTYVEARVNWIGPVWQPPLGINHESVLEHVLIGAPGMERSIREWRLVLHALDQAQSYELKSILLNKLRSGRYLIIPNPTHTKTFLEEAIYATMVGQPKAVAQAAYPYWTTEVTFREVVD